MLLNGTALADEGVLSGLGRRACETALHHRTDGRRTELGGDARRAAEELALREHGFNTVVKRGFGVVWFVNGPDLREAKMKLGVERGAV